jgi:hypothetical protein
MAKATAPMVGLAVRMSIRTKARLIPTAVASRLVAMPLFGRSAEAPLS